ncbi:hypothetical protein D9M69_729160 [compost metagenome]
MTDGRLDLQFAAGAQSEVDHIERLARHPPIFSHPGNRDKPHARRLLNHVENRRGDRDAGNGIQVCLKIMRHCLMSPEVAFRSPV